MRLARRRAWATACRCANGHAVQALSYKHAVRSVKFRPRCCWGSERVVGRLDFTEVRRRNR